VSANIGIYAAERSLHQRAVAIAKRYGLPMLCPGAKTSPFNLVLTDKRLELREDNSLLPPLYVDFGNRSQLRRLPGRSRREDLVRALGRGVAGSGSIVDATAGLGRDAFMLAAWGYQVHAIERVPAVAALLEDGVQRALIRQNLCEAAARISLYYGDARELLLRLPARPDVVYLDPMYPQIGKRARKSLGMHQLRHVLGDDRDATSLFEIALGTAVRRIVVKRSRRAPTLGGQPSGSIVGRTTRFDLYAPTICSDA
jgi:16S rRNA (guanine1516-N2)-methyltransferase